MAPSSPGFQPPENPGRLRSTRPCITLSLLFSWIAPWGTRWGRKAATALMQCDAGPWRRRPRHHYGRWHCAKPKRQKSSATFMTSTIDELPHVFATLRFAGDNLDPEQISAVLGIAPRRAYQKGEAYYSGKRAVTLSGRTGIWLLFTDRLTASRDLADHLAILESLLCPAPHDIRRLARLRDIVN